MSRLLELLHQSGQSAETHETDLRQRHPTLRVQRVQQNVQVETPSQESRGGGAFERLVSGTGHQRARDGLIINMFVLFLIFFIAI